MSYLGSERRAVDRREPRIVDVRPTFAHIDLHALGNNLRRVRDTVGSGCRILAVVKADAYGHGALDASRALVEAGAWGLAVSLVEEGIELRQAGIRGPIIVLGGVSPGSEDVIVHRALTPVVWEPEQLEMLGCAVARSGAPPLSVHLKIDTGMSRLGVLPKDLGNLVDGLSRAAKQHLCIEGVMTHLACADEEHDDHTLGQLRIYSECLETLGRRGLKPEIRHVCNSAGLVRYPAAHFDMVRPGIALYGAASSRACALPGLEMAMSFHSRILAIRELPAGVSVSYGHRAVLKRDSRLGLVPVGYGDGYARKMSGRAEVLVRGHRCRVVGNITMDLSMIDVTDIPGARVGEKVTLLGDQGHGNIGLYEMSEWADLIPYEVLCGISKRVPRRA